MTQQTIDRALPEIIKRLRGAFQPSKIYLFGSCVTGRIGPDSDVDLLVVVPDTELSFFQRAAVAYRALRGVPVPIDVQVYTAEEFDARASLPVSFERTVRQKGRILYAA